MNDNTVFEKCKNEMYIKKKIQMYSMVVDIPLNLHNNCYPLGIF